jgi:dCMP deaminase
MATQGSAGKSNGTNGRPHGKSVLMAGAVAPGAVAEPEAARIARENRHKYFMGIAIAVRLRANCTGNRVGAVVALNNRIVSTGYNGTPDNMPNCLDGGCYRCLNRDKTYKSGQAYDLCICVHAEQNALLAAACFGIAVRGSNVYTTMRPCFGCAKEMLQAQVHAIYFLHEWSPVATDDMLKTKAQEHEYEKLLLRFPGGVHLLSMPDLDETWAVAAKRSLPSVVNAPALPNVQ